MSSSLSTHKRSVIETMIKLNYAIREIARFLKCSPATINYKLNQIKPYKIHHGLLKVKVSDLPDKGIQRKHQSDGCRRVFSHGLMGVQLTNDQKLFN